MTDTLKQAEGTVAADANAIVAKAEAVRQTAKTDSAAVLQTAEKDVAAVKAEAKTRPWIVVAGVSILVAVVMFLLLHH